MPPPPVCIKFYIQPPLSLVVTFSYAPPPPNFPTTLPPPGNYCTVPKLRHASKINGHLHTHLHLGISSTGEMGRPNTVVTQISMIKICIVLTLCKINSKTELHLKPVFRLTYRMLTNVSAEDVTAQHFSHFQLQKRA